MADFTEATINGQTRDVNVKNGKLSEAKLDQQARAKLFAHEWLTQEEYDTTTPVEGMTYIIYEEETV